MSAAKVQAPAQPVDDKSRPLLLQVNDSGSWRNVMRFELQDYAEVTRAAGALFGWSTSADRLSLRLVIPHAVPVVLWHWTAERGWKPVNTAEVAA